MISQWLLQLAIVALFFGANQVATAERFAGSDKSHHALSASYTGIGSSHFEGVGTGQRTDVRETRLAADFLLSKSKISEITLGVDYQYTRYEYDGVAGRDRDLHRMQFPIGWHYQGNAWHLDTEVAAGVSTSSNVFQNFLSEANSDDNIITARIEALYPIPGTDLQWLVGILHDRTFGKPQLYPALGMVYSPTARIAMRLAFPNSAIRYTSTDQQRWSAQIFPAGHEWNVVSAELDTQFKYQSKALRLQATWSKKINSAFWLDLSTGYEFRRNQRFIDDLGQLIDTDIKPRILFQIGFHRGYASGPTDRLFPNP